MPLDDPPPSPLMDGLALCVASSLGVESLFVLLPFTSFMMSLLVFCADKENNCVAVLMGDPTRLNLFLYWGASLASIKSKRRISCDSGKGFLAYRYLPSLLSSTEFGAKFDVPCFYCSSFAILMASANSFASFDSSSAGYKPILNEPALPSPFGCYDSCFLDQKEMEQVSFVCSCCANGQLWHWLIVIAYALRFKRQHASSITALVPRDYFTFIELTSDPVTSKSFCGKLSTILTT